MWRKLLYLQAEAKNAHVRIYQICLREERFSGSKLENLKKGKDAIQSVW
jgi:hypothetical protein